MLGISRPTRRCATILRGSPVLAVFRDLSTRREFLASRFTLVLTAMLIGLLSPAQATDHGNRSQPVFGAGPSTQIAKMFFEHFNRRPEARGISFTVPERSVKHRGGIRASSTHLFGRTGRPLSTDEKALHKSEIILAKIPIGFATGDGVSPPPMAVADIEAIFAGRVDNWHAHGGPDAPIVLVGREKSEAVLTSISSRLPVLLDAPYRHVFKRDHAVVNFLRSDAGRHAIGFGALSNFGELNTVTLVDATLGVEVGLVVDRKNADHPVVTAARTYAASAEWLRIVQDAGYHAAGATGPDDTVAGR